MKYAIVTAEIDAVLDILLKLQNSKSRYLPSKKTSTEGLKNADRIIYIQGISHSYTSSKSILGNLLFEFYLSVFPY